MQVVASVGDRLNNYGNRFPSLMISGKGCMYRKRTEQENRAILKSVMNMAVGLEESA